MSDICSERYRMLFLIISCFLATGGYVLGECSTGCQQPTLLYEDLNCKPIFASPDDCCPSEYDCSHIDERATANEEKCYFHGKTYNIGENINDDEVYGYWKADCTCQKKSSGNMGFGCAIVECPEDENPLGNAKPGCYLKYELGKGCSVGEACPPFSATCQVDGKTYHEGQTFDAPNTKCTQCLCQEGFAGKFEAPFCKKRGCIVEVEAQIQVKNFCAPSYLSHTECCPFNWICPREDDNIVPAATLSKNSDVKCKFGQHKLSVGDKFKRTSRYGGRLSCECHIPPYLTCVQNIAYPANDPEL